MPAAIPQVPVLGPGLDAVAETSTSRRLNFELEEGKKGLNAVNVKVDGPLASQPEPDGGPRTVIQAKGAIIIDDHLIMAKGKQPEDAVAGKCRGWFWPFLKYVWHELKCYDDPTNSG